MTYVLLLVIAAAIAYQLLALLASLRRMASRAPEQRGWTPGVSILKPVRGLDPGFFRSIRSHALQDYPDFEILFGVADADDPAVPEIERLAAEFPGCKIRLIHSTRKAPNRKTGVLEALAAEAAYPILLVNDSDITVSSGYLREVAGPLQDEGIGVVTCLYRGAAESWPDRMEALGVATDFVPSVLVAPLFGVREFGLGSTLAFRAAELEAIGGFRAINDYIADDYFLTKRITALGFRTHLSHNIVDTTFASGTWKAVWQHQVRWHRTIRTSKGPAYYGILLTQATLWAVVAALAGMWPLAAVALAVRMAAGLACGVGVLRCPQTARLFWLIPLRDLGGAAVWVAGLWGSTVQWRGRRLTLSRDGRIIDESPAPNDGG